MEKVANSYVDRLYKSYPYLLAREGFWINEDDKCIDISDEREFNDSYLLSCYGLLKKEYKNLFKDEEKYLDELECVHNEFQHKMKEILDEIDKRGLTHRIY